LEVDEGWRTLPYLGDGSAGLGMVLDDYLVHAAATQCDKARSGILTAATSRFYAQPGLFQGRAGMILHLGRTTESSATDRHLAEQIAALGWDAMAYEGQLRFPVDQVLPQSM